MLESVLILFEAQKFIVCKQNKEQKNRNAVSILYINDFGRS